MLEGSQTGKQKEPRERIRASVDEGAAQLLMRQAGHASGYCYRNGKPEKSS